MIQDIVGIYFPRVLGQVIIDYCRIGFTWREDAVRHPLFQGSVSEDGTVVTNPDLAGLNAFAVNESLGSFAPSRFDFQVTCDKSTHFGFAYEGPFPFNCHQNFYTPFDVQIHKSFEVNRTERVAAALPNVIFHVIIDKLDRCIIIDILDPSGGKLFEQPITFHDLMHGMEHFIPYVSFNSTSCLILSISNKALKSHCLILT